MTTHEPADVARAVTIEAPTQPRRRPVNAARDLDLTGMTWAGAHRTLERLQPAIADLLDAIDRQPVWLMGHRIMSARDAVAAALTGETP